MTNQKTDRKTAAYSHNLVKDISKSWLAGRSNKWTPKIPTPLFYGVGLSRAKCGCGKKFKTHEDYYSHYLYRAIWRLESSILPLKWFDKECTKSTASEATLKEIKKVLTDNRITLDATTVTLIRDIVDRAKGAE